MKFENAGLNTCKISQPYLISYCLYLIPIFEHKNKLFLFYVDKNRKYILDYVVGVTYF